MVLHKVSAWLHVETERQKVLYSKHFVTSQKRPYHVTFEPDVDLEHILDAGSNGDNRVQVWWRSSHLSATTSDFREITSVEFCCVRAHESSAVGARIVLQYRGFLHVIHRCNGSGRVRYNSTTNLYAHTRARVRAHEFHELMQSRGARRPSVRPSVCL